MTPEYPLVCQKPRNKNGKGNQNNFTRVFPRSDFGKAKISYLCYDFYAGKPSYPRRTRSVSAWSALNFM